MKRTGTGFAYSLVWMLAAPASASAQAVAEFNETVVYDAEYFAQYLPQTALDMVERVPGFTIDEGEDRRGFAGAQGNVLIDGAPPASKSQDLDDVLERIPASDVVRIELLRGVGSAAGRAQGVRVNVVRRLSSGAGVWEIAAWRTEDGRISPSAEAAWSGRLRSFEYGLSAGVSVERAPVRGLRFDYDAAGVLFERRAEAIPVDEREAQLAGELTVPWLGGALSLNAQFNRAEVDETEATRLFDGLGAPSGVIAGVLEEHETLAEAGASFSRAWGDWRGEAAAVATRRRFDADEETAEFSASGALDEAARQAQRIDAGETILRAALQRPLPGRWSLGLGAEAAFNTLEQRLTLVEDDGGGPTPVVLPSANVRVEEERAEANVLFSRQADPHWTVDVGAAVERSRLTQSGDTLSGTELTFWKPSLQIARAFGAQNQARVRFYRDVGQLDFEDFVSASDITASLVDAGNPDLRPETSWRLEAEGDWRFGDGGALTVTLYRWQVEDAFDIVPIGSPGDLFDAPGNIGDADVHGARVALTLPLAWGGQVRLDALVQDSRATDPLTGGERAQSGFDEDAIALEFRQDLSSWAWGIDYERETEAPSFRLDRIEREQDAEELTLWVETTAWGRVKLRAWGANLIDSAEERRRLLYDPDRLSAFAASDARVRGEGLSFGVSASGRF